MKIFSPRAHGALDYLTVVLFALAPTTLGLTGWAATLAYVLAGVHLLITLVTAFPLGIVGVVSMKLHGTVELVVALVLLGLGLAATLGTVDGFADPAGIFYLAMGAVIFVVWLTTAYREHAHSSLS